MGGSLDAMTAPRRSLIASAALAAVLTTAVSGCSVSVGKVSVDHSELEKSISDQLTKQVGQRPDKITCPDDLEGKVGATTRCTLTAGSDKLGVTAKTTSVKGKNVRFSIKVDEKVQ